MKLTVFQSDKGDCLLITSQDGKHILADGGMRASYKAHVARVLIKLHEDGGSLDTWGSYLYGQYKFATRWIAGLRWDLVEAQREAGREYWGLSPYLTFWQSEFVRLRGQLSYRDDNRYGVDRRFELQLTFAAGPHKHENY